MVQPISALFTANATLNGGIRVSIIPNRTGVTLVLSCATHIHSLKAQVSIYTMRDFPLTDE